MLLCLRLFYYIDFSLFTYASPSPHIKAFESDTVCETVCVYVFVFVRILSSKYNISNVSDSGNNVWLLFFYFENILNLEISVISPV